MEIIEVENLSWRYSLLEESVIQQINFKANTGDFIGVMGPTGSGKSTFALALRGVLAEFFEEGRLEGSACGAQIDLTRSSPQLFADRIGLVFQDAASQVLGTTVFEDMAFGLSNLGLPKKSILERIDRYSAKVGLSNKLLRSPATLSGGELQRLAIASVLCMEPTILILDEPASELDPIGKNELCILLNDLRQDKNITIILIEQNPELIVGFADKLALFDKGRIVLFGPPLEIFGDIQKCIEIGVNPPGMVRLSASLEEAFGIKFNTPPLSAGEMYSQIKKLKDIPQIQNKQAMGFMAESTSVRMEEFDSGLSRTVHKPENNPVIIRVCDLHYSYLTVDDHISALNGLNLEIFQGDYIALVGPNGAGKTTFTKQLNGMLAPTRGNVYYKETDITLKNNADLVFKIGYCFQNPDHQIFEETVFDEIAFGLKNMGLDSTEIEKRVDRVLELIDLSDHRRTHPHNLGNGQRQKIALASTIVLEPEVLIVDEPTTGLDCMESERILDLIYEMCLQGTTTIVVTHDMDIVQKYAKRMIAMADGKILFDGPPNQAVCQKGLFNKMCMSTSPVFEFAHLLQSDPNFNNSQFLQTVAEMAISPSTRKLD